MSPRNSPTKTPKWSNLLGGRGRNNYKTATKAIVNRQFAWFACRLVILPFPPALSGLAGLPWLSLRVLQSRLCSVSLVLFIHKLKIRGTKSRVWWFMISSKKGRYSYLSIKRTVLLHDLSKISPNFLFKVLYNLYLKRL